MHACTAGRSGRGRRLQRLVPRLLALQNAVGQPVVGAEDAAGVGARSVEGRRRSTQRNATQRKQHPAAQQQRSGLTGPGWQTSAGWSCRQRRGGRAPLRPSWRHPRAHQPQTRRLTEGACGEQWWVVERSEKEAGRRPGCSKARQPCSSAGANAARAKRASGRPRTFELVDAHSRKGLLDERGGGQPLEGARHAAFVDEQSAEDYGHEDDCRPDGQRRLCRGRGGAHRQAQRLRRHGLQDQHAQEGAKPTGLRVEPGGGVDEAAKEGGEQGANGELGGQLGQQVREHSIPCSRALPSHQRLLAARSEWCGGGEQVEGAGVRMRACRAGRQEASGLQPGLSKEGRHPC